MRRSFGGGSRGMGGGSGGGGGGSGGGMLRTIHRAVRAGVSGGGATHEPFTHGTNTTNTIKTTTQTCKNKSNTSSKNSLTLSSSASNNSNSSPFSSHNIPKSAASSTKTWLPTGSSPPYSACDESEWEQLDGSEDERVYQHAYFDDVVFGNIPSRDEVQHAVSALQQVLEPSSFSFIKDRLDCDSEKEEGDRVCCPTGCVHALQSDGPDSDWIEPSVHLSNSKALKPYGTDRVYDAFRLLNNEPAVQRMVISLSTDNAMWNAVLNNEAVREYREFLNQGSADTDSSASSNEGSGDSPKGILSWIFMNIKAKVAELVEKIMKIATEAFQPISDKNDAGTVNPMEENLRAAFLLSVVVLLIVVVNRATEA